MIPNTQTASADPSLRIREEVRHSLARALKGVEAKSRTHYQKTSIKTREKTWDAFGGVGTAKKISDWCFSFEMLGDFLVDFSLKVSLVFPLVNFCC